MLVTFHLKQFFGKDDEAAKRMMPSLVPQWSLVPEVDRERREGRGEGKKLRSFPLPHLMLSIEVIYNNNLGTQSTTTMNKTREICLRSEDVQGITDIKKKFHPQKKRKKETGPSRNLG